MYQSEFFAKKREELGDPSAKLRITEYSREASDAWKALPEDVKERYNAQRAADADKWERAYREWYEALDADAIAEIEAVKGKTLSFPAARLRTSANRPRRTGRLACPQSPSHPSSSSPTSSEARQRLEGSAPGGHQGGWRQVGQMSDADKQSVRVQLTRRVRAYTDASSGSRTLPRTRRQSTRRGRRRPLRRVRTL